MKRYFFFFSLILMGCKTEIEIPIKLSQFDSADKSIQVTSRIGMEVPSCTERDTDMPSDTVFKLQKQVPYVFKGAEYVDCKTVNYRSYALFTVPVNIDNVMDDKPVDEQMINVSFYKNDTNEYRSLNMYIPPKLRDSINKLIESNPYANVDNMNISMNIDPEGKPIVFTIVGAYLSNDPVQYGDFSNNGGEFSVKIPSYGLRAMLSKDDGLFTVLANVAPQR